MIKSKVNGLLLSLFFSSWAFAQGSSSSGGGDLFVIGNVLKTYQQIQQDIAQLGDLALSANEVSQLKKMFLQHDFQFLSSVKELVPSQLQLWEGYLYTGYVVSDGYLEFKNRKNLKMIYINRTVLAALKTEFEREENLLNLLCESVCEENASARIKSFMGFIKNKRADAEVIPTLFKDPRTHTDGERKNAKIEAKTIFAEVLRVIQEHLSFFKKNQRKRIKHALTMEISTSPIILEEGHTAAESPARFESALSEAYHSAASPHQVKEDILLNIDHWIDTDARLHRLLLFHEFCVIAGVEASGMYDETIRFSEFLE